MHRENTKLNIKLDNLIKELNEFIVRSLNTKRKVMVKSSEEYIGEK